MTENAARYRKKPVEIDAIGPIDVDNAESIAHWCGGRVLSSAGGVAISTLEGEMRADPGDFVIRGVKGEHYPCKPDIFDATYEPVEDDEDDDGTPVSVAHDDDGRVYEVDAADAAS